MLRSGAIGECSTSRPAPARGQRRSLHVCNAAKEVTLLDYGAGNVRSVRNAIKALGYTIKDVSRLLLALFASQSTGPSSQWQASPILQVEKAADIAKADRLIFPGVGSFGQAMRILNKKGLTHPQHP